MKKASFSKGILCVMTLYLLLPLALTFLYSLFSEWTDILPTGFTLKYYKDILPRPEFYTAIGRTLLICACPIILTALIMLLVMYVTTVYAPKLDKYVQVICMIPYALQGIIVAISILTLYSGFKGIFGNRILMLVGAYCVIILPYMYQGMRNAISAINARQLIEAAQVLGTSKVYAYFRIVVPNILSGIVISSMLSLGIIFGDFVVANLIAGSYYETASIFLFKMMRTSGQTTSAIIVVLSLVTLTLSVFAFRLRNKKSETSRRKL